MEIDLKIKDIKNVFEGEFKPGILPRKTIGRYCDCFVYYICGKAEYIFDNYSFVSMPQNFIYLSKDSIYAINVLEKSKFICIDFEFDVVSQQTSNIFECNCQSIKNQFQKIFNIWNEKKISYLPQIFSYTYGLYSEAIQLENKLYAKNNLLISDMISYILQHYTEKSFTVQDIANEFGISEVHLRRIFKRSEYISPIKYINSLKIDKAKNMLRVSNYTIAEIAFSAGFDDPYYFSRLFKKETGISPSAYRKNSRW